MVDYRIVLLFSITLILTWLSIVMYRRSREHLSFSIFVFSVGIWSFTLGMMYFSTSSKFLDLWGRMVYVSGSLIPVLFYRFSVVFTNKKIYKWWSAFLFFSVTFVSYIYLFTPLFLKEVTSRNNFRGFVYGDARLVFDIYFDLIFLAGFLTMSQGLFYDKKRRTQFIFITIGTLTGLILAGSTNVILPLFNRFEYLWAGPVGAAVWAAILTYGILRHQLMNIKVIATEIFAGIIWILLLMNVFFFQSPSELVFNIFLFLASILIGGLLIQSVIREVEQKEKVERLSAELTTANQELKKLDQAKSEFVSIASHQLRAPLTVIRGYVSLALEGTLGQIGEQVKDSLLKVSISANQLVKLVSDLLNLSRIESGKIQYEFKPVELPLLVEKVVREFKINAEKKAIRLAFEKPADSLPALNADPDKLREVVINLIDNAIKYSPQNGSVAVSLGNSKTGNGILFSVKDSGIGIGREDAARIFTKFTRTEEARKADPNGMGIGLYFVKRVVEDHKGRVWFESEGEGKGTTFFVELPLNKRIMQ